MMNLPTFMVGPGRSGGYSLWILAGYENRPGGSSQKRYFRANWISRGATEFWVITPNVAVLSEVPGFANCGWFNAL